MSTVLITGANRGIGYETARVLIANGDFVWLGCRDRDAGKRAADELGATFVPLDVTDDASVATAAAVVGDLDVLVNNAAVLNEPTPIGQLKASVVNRVFNTNVVGAVRVTNAFLPSLAASAHPRIVNVTSGIGSLTESADAATEFDAFPADVYRASKAALNMFTIQYAKAYRGIRINCVDPGLTRTDMMGRAVGQPIPDAAEMIVRVIGLGPEGPTGRFLGPGGNVAW